MVDPHERKPGAKADEAAEVQRLIEELQAAGQKHVRPRATFPSPPKSQTWPAARETYPSNPIQPIPAKPISAVAMAIRHPISAIGRQQLATFDWIRRLRIGRLPSPMGRYAVWACVCLGVALGISMVYWPYTRACGSGLACYMGAVGVLYVAGVWSAWHAWDSRIGVAHVMALGTVLWACSLTAHEVLPRVGYAKTSASWSCSIDSFQS